MYSALLCKYADRSSRKRVLRPYTIWYQSGNQIYEVCLQLRLWVYSSRWPNSVELDDILFTSTQYHVLGLISSLLKSPSMYSSARTLNQYRLTQKLHMYTIIYLPAHSIPYYSLNQNLYKYNRHSIIKRAHCYAGAVRYRFK